VVRHEPIGIEILESYLKCMWQFQRVGWLPFLQKFQGHDKQVTKAFAKYLDGTKAQIGDLHLQL